MKLHVYSYNCPGLEDRDPRPFKRIPEGKWWVTLSEYPHYLEMTRVYLYFYDRRLTDYETTHGSLDLSVIEELVKFVLTLPSEDIIYDTRRGEVVTASQPAE